MSEPKKYKYIPKKLYERAEIRNLDKKKLVEYLLSAFADEVLAWYQYYISLYAVKGNVSSEIEEVFKKIAEDELNDHAKQLADRLQHFDVDPPDFRDLWNLSKCKQTELPEDPHDIDGFLIAAILAEECALKYYREIFQYVFGKDPKNESEHKIIFRNLLPEAICKKT